MSNFFHDGGHVGDEYSTKNVKILVSEVKLNYEIIYNNRKDLENKNHEGFVKHLNVKGNNTEKITDSEFANRLQKYLIRNDFIF